MQRRHRGHGKRPRLEWFANTYSYSNQYNMAVPATSSYSPVYSFPLVQSAAGTVQAGVAGGVAVPLGNRYTVHAIRGDILMQLKAITAVPGDEFFLGMGIAKTSFSAGYSTGANPHPCNVQDANKDWLWLWHGYYLNTAFGFINILNALSVPVVVKTKRRIEEEEILNLCVGMYSYTNAGQYTWCVMPNLRSLVGEAA